MSVRLHLHDVIYHPDSFVLVLCYCAPPKAIRYKSMSFNRIVADKLHRVNCHLTSTVLLVYDIIYQSYVPHKVYVPPHESAPINTLSTHMEGYKSPMCKRPRENPARESNICYIAMFMAAKSSVENLMHLLVPIYQKAHYKIYSLCQITV